MDGDIIEQLLRQPDLTLEGAITTCRAQEAAKKQCREMSDRTSEAILAVRQRRQPPNTQPNQHPVTCPGCGSKPHLGGRARCPAYQQTCHHCHKVGHFARVCRAYGAPTQSPRPRPPIPSTKSLQSMQTEDAHHPQLSTIKQVTATEPAPNIDIHILSLNGSCDTPALPDSGADISAAGSKFLQLLNEHTQPSPIRDILPNCQ